MKPLSFYKTNQTAGFTLIEVLVVVVIAAILAGITAPGWLAFLNRQRVSTVRSDLVQTLRNTQQDAIQRRTTVPVQINDGAALSIVVNDQEQRLGDDDSNPGGLTLRSYSIGADGAQNDGFSTIFFNYQGMPSIGTNPADASPSSDRLPFVVSVQVGDSGDQQCVIVASLLGSLKTASNAECENPDLAID